jgi:hypothetical protein
MFFPLRSRSLQPEETKTHYKLAQQTPNPNHISFPVFLEESNMLIGVQDVHRIFFGDGSRD